MTKRLFDDPLPIIGVLSLNSIIPRLPFASNHLGISEETTVALLCSLTELFEDNPDNARSAIVILLRNHLTVIIIINNLYVIQKVP